MDDTLLDLLDAITEIRVKNPELRTSVLAAMRLTTSVQLIDAGRLYAFHPNGDTRSIIAHGGASITEEDDLEIISECNQERDPIIRGAAHAFPLGKEQRLYGVLILENPKGSVGALLADVFLQWCAVSEFLLQEKEELLDENFHLREEIKVQYSDHNIVGVSGAFRHVVEQGRRVASSTATVLIHGETGTGKELVARLIHDNSPRANKPMISVNCGALSESLLESELFGHVKGAFTGAVSDRKGRFEAAQGGTIFLDEIGEISPAMQVRLLRVLQEAEIVRVGDHKTRKLDVRVLAATNRDLEKEVHEGNFRADLFYRLNVVYLSVPALRQRPEDIPLLLEHFLGKFSQRNCKYIEGISREALEIMKSYPWPGNVRELENCVEKMVVMAPGREINSDLLPMALMAYSGKAPPDHGPQAADLPADSHSGPSFDPQNFEDQLRHFLWLESQESKEAGRNDLYSAVRSKWERYLFEAVLELCNNNKSKAAQLLGITRNTLNTHLNDLSNVKREWTVT